MTQTSHEHDSVPSSPAFTGRKGHVKSDTYWGPRWSSDCPGGATVQSPWWRPHKAGEHTHTHRDNAWKHSRQQSRCVSTVKLVLLFDGCVINVIICSVLLLEVSSRGSNTGSKQTQAAHEALSIWWSHGQFQRLTAGGSWSLTPTGPRCPLLFVCVLHLVDAALISEDGHNRRTERTQDMWGRRHVNTQTDLKSVSDDATKQSAQCLVSYWLYWCALLAFLLEMLRLDG